jgi:uncharacterized protein
LARPPIERAVGGVPHVTLFKPAGVPGRDLEQLPLGVDELEALRLVDLEGLSHEQAASAMGVSRQTVGRVLEAARGKVAEALITGKAILIGGGQYRVEPRKLCCRSCGAQWTSAAGDVPPTACPTCGAPDVVTCWDPARCCGSAEGVEGDACGRHGRGGRRQGAGDPGSGRGGRGRGPGRGRGQPEGC